MSQWITDTVRDPMIKKKKGDENEFKIHMFEEHMTRTLVTQNKLSEERARFPGIHVWCASVNKM